MDKPEPHCTRCNDHGTVIIRNTYTMSYVCAGPGRDDMRGMIEVECECANTNPALNDELNG